MLALAIIAKDEVEKVVAIIDKYGKYFDEIVIGADQRIEEFQALATEKVKVYPYEWINDFSHKRNFLAEKVSCPYYFRMDTDDEIENPDIIPELMRGIVAHDIDIFYAIYDYAKDQKGNVVAKHWRETIIRKRPDVYWKKAIHENIFMEDQQTCKLTRDKRLKIVHNIDQEHAMESFRRNFNYLLEEYKRDGERTDPRTLAYLGRMLMGEGLYDRAVLFLEKLVEKSGWDDDKYFAWVQMSQCYVFMGKVDLAIACCNEALALNTMFPDAYLQMGAVYLYKEDYQKAVDWIMPGLVRPEPDTVMVLDPTFYTFNARMNAAMALLGKGDMELATKYFNEAKAFNPDDPDIKKYEPLFVDAHELSIYVKNLMWLLLYTKGKDRSKVKNLVESIPQHAYRDERVWAIRNEFLSPREWDDKEIAFFCGSAWEEWSPVSTLKGIGGSEEAVIYLSNELTKLGYKVTVFNNCGEMAGTYSGVEYKPFQAFNPKDKYNILISWRGHSLRGITAKQRIIWLHDVPIEGMFREESVNDFDKVIVLSQYHRTLLPDFIPEEKIFVSSNGINTADFNTNGVLRNTKRMIYTSSYDRGLEHLLEMWPDIRKAVPEAELHVFYGWDVYDQMMKKGARVPEFKNRMLPLLQQEGVTEHGRIGHKQLVKELQKSGVWVYPSHFEEISCISAMKAQAAGCVPVCTDYAALNETVKAGIKVKGSMRDAESKEAYQESLAKVLSEEDWQEEVRKEVSIFKEVFGWDSVARSWAEHLFTSGGVLV